MARVAAIAFAGTPQFAVPALRALIDAGFAVPVVLTQPDRSAGRGRRVATSPVKQFAEAHKLRVHQPATLPRSREPGGQWDSVPDLLVVVAYGLLLPQWLLEWPRVAAVNIHASLLPRWRGAAPIQHAILAGDAQTGISIMKMERGLDTGPVYAQEHTDIGADETAAQLHDRLSAIGAGLLLATLAGILDGSLAPAPQDAAAVTYAPKISKQQAGLDWGAAAAVLARQVRAFDPWPVAQGRLDDGRILRIWKAQALDERAGGEPGTIISAAPTGIVVATGAGQLRIETLQPPGSRPMSAQAYLNAHALTGNRFVS